MFTRCWLPPESVDDLVVAAVGEAGLLEHPLHGRLDVGNLLEAREQPEVLGHGEPPVQRGLLGDEADLPRRPGNLPLVGAADAREDREQRRLAGAVRADHRQELARAPR